MWSGHNPLFSEKLNYSRLGLVITDEEHRFGVKQREALEKKGPEWSACDHYVCDTASKICC